MPKTQREIFQATLAHEPHDETLFYASFTPACQENVQNYYNLNDEQNLQSFFGMFSPVTVGLKPSEEGETKPDFSVYEAARRIKPDIAIWYHSDGNITDIIPELIDIGVTILNPVQPECMDLNEIKRTWGDKLVLDGTIGTQTTMPFDSPEQVQGTVRQRKRDLGQDGALILSPTHVLEPDVPAENIDAFTRASKEDFAEI